MPRDTNISMMGIAALNPSYGLNNLRRLRRLVASNRLADLEPLELRVVKVQRLVISCATMRCPERL